METCHLNETRRIGAMCEEIALSLSSLPALFCPTASLTFAILLFWAWEMWRDFHGPPREFQVVGLLYRLVILCDPAGRMVHITNTRAHEGSLEGATSNSDWH